MNRFIQFLITFCLSHKWLTLGLIPLITGLGIYSFVHTPIEAFPDVTNTKVEIITLWPGRSAQEVERSVTLPIEIALNAAQKRLNIRSTTMFGLSKVSITFDDGVSYNYARTQVNNVLTGIDIPSDATMNIQPPMGATSEIYRYTLTSESKTLRQLTEWQEWYITRSLKSVPGIADVATFGGEQKVFEVAVDPNRLRFYSLSAQQIFDALENSNLNVGGNVLNIGTQAYVVRGVGLLEDIEEIKNVIVGECDGNPVFIKSVADVRESCSQRVGRVSRQQEDDVVEGIVLMRRGENPSLVLEHLKEKIRYLNDRLAPEDITIKPFYDRTFLTEYSKHTVLKNLAEGIVLVIIVVLFFLTDWRIILAVGMVIPLSLLFAFICLRIMGMSANLLSLGAIDFGIITDGAVIMAEGLLVYLSSRAKEMGMAHYNKAAKGGMIRREAIRLAKPVFFAKAIIIIALMPIFMFQKVEGYMFRPLAYTLGFALLGALILSLTVVPVVIRLLLNRNARERENRFAAAFHHFFYRIYDFFFERRVSAIAGCAVLLCGAFVLFGRLGHEFLPTLNEGALRIEVRLNDGSSVEETGKVIDLIRKDLMEFEEINEVMAQIGRPNDGTETSGLNYCNIEVNLKTAEELKRHVPFDVLVTKIDERLSRYPGIVLNYSQPINDRIGEAITGLNANLAVKVYGKDPFVLDSIGNSMAAVLREIDGIEDVGVWNSIGQPELNIKPDEKRMALYGVKKEDVQRTIEMAVGGAAATSMYEGERYFDVVVRVDRPFRDTPDKIGELCVEAIDGKWVPLKEICDITKNTGPFYFFREELTRYVAVKFTVRNRDLGGAISEAQHRIGECVSLPPLYSLRWTGEFENLERAAGTLAKVVPVSLLAILCLLFVNFGNIKDALIVLCAIPLSFIGGTLGLAVSGIHFGISAGIGFIALFGISILNAVVLSNAFKMNLSGGLSLKESISKGMREKLRPVLMTATMATVGLIPAALSTGIGSESQRPLAVVIIGGLTVYTLLVCIVYPILFYYCYRKWK